MPLASTQAIVPPPAPMVTRSIAGKMIGMLNSACHSERNIGVPFTITEMSALVPPMSSVITFSNPTRSATARPPITPAAGPDWQTRAGMRVAAREVMSPPPEWVMRTSPS